MGILRELFTNGKKSPEAPQRYNGDRGYEVYVHAQLDEGIIYGMSTDTQHVPGGPLDKEITEAMLYCNYIDKQIHEGTVTYDEGLRAIGRKQSSLITIAPPGTPIDTTGLYEIKPLDKSAEAPREHSLPSHISAVALRLLGRP